MHCIGVTNFIINCSNMYILKSSPNKNLSLNIELKTVRKSVVVNMCANCIIRKCLYAFKRILLKIRKTTILNNFNLNFITN